MKSIIRVLVISVLLFSLASAGDESIHDRIIPKPLVDSIIFGVGAGLLCGFLVFPHNGWPGQNIMEGASVGLYGGTALGLYLSYKDSKRQLEDASVGVNVIQENSKVSGASLHFNWLSF